MMHFITKMVICCCNYLFEDAKAIRVLMAYNFSSYNIKQFSHVKCAGVKWCATMYTIRIKRVINMVGV